MEKRICPGADMGRRGVYFPDMWRPEEKEIRRCEPRGMRSTSREGEVYGKEI